MEMDDDVSLPSMEVFDEVDIANAIEMENIKQALLNHQKKLAPETHPDFDGESCLDCGAEIPPARLAMFKIRCVDCQSMIEKKSKLYNR